MKREARELKREIGLLGLSANMVNIMIGAGIFVLPAIVAAGLGTASIVAYLFCGVLIALIMLCFAEVGSSVTNAGGPYAYIATAFGPYFGFLTAVLFLCAAVTADAAVANALADMISTMIPLFRIQWVKILFFILIFSGLGLINIVGVNRGVGLVKLITIAKLTPLLLLVLVGWTDINLSNLAWDSMPTVTDIGEISLILFFAFQGGESGLTVSGEVRNPKKTVPKAILISIGGVLVLYILVQTIAQGVLGASLSTFTASPLSETAKVIFGPIGFALMTIGAAISMFGNLSSEVLSIPRVVYGAARDGVIPINQLAAVHPTYATPYMAIALYAMLGLLLAALGGFQQLAILSSASILLIYLGVVFAVIKFRREGNSLPGAFRMPGGYSVPIASALIILWFLSNLTHQEKTGIIIFAGLLTGLFFALRFKNRR